MSLGLAHPFARPARSAVLAAAVAFGATGVTFAVGLGITLHGVEAAGNRQSAGAVVVPMAGGGGPGRSAAPANGPTSRPDPDPAAVAARIAEQPGTARFYSMARTEVGVAGVTGAANVVAYAGDSSNAEYRMISGRWFRGADEVVTSSRFLDVAGVRVGDTITLTEQGRRSTLRVVGEAFDLSADGMNLLTDRSSVAGLGLDLDPYEFDVELSPGTDAAAYVRTINTSLAGLGVEAVVNTHEVSATLLAMESLIATLTLLLVAVAGFGVLNTVVLDTRERVRDLGVFKAVGMTPRQTVTMVVTSVAGIGLVAGVVGVAAGAATHGYVVPLMGQASSTGIPRADLDVYHLREVVPLALSGLVIAAAGAVLPAGWAARTRTATALRTD